MIARLRVGNPRSKALTGDVYKTCGSRPSLTLAQNHNPNFLT